MKLSRSIIIAFLLAAAVASAQKATLPKKIFSDAEKQTRTMLEEIPKAKANKADLVSPRTLDSAANLKLVNSRDWTSGFFPGELWFLNEYTRNNDWKKQAEDLTVNIEKEKTNATTHDMGF